MTDNQGVKKVLLVEDDPFIAGMYQTKLKLEGYEVDTAGDGEAALSKLETGQYVIVLLDIMMPKLNGFEVLKEIRGGDKKSISDIPVIMLTNLGQKSDIEQGLMLGANDYIVKANFTPSEVVEKIKRLIQ